MHTCTHKCLPTLHTVVDSGSCHDQSIGQELREQVWVRGDARLQQGDTETPGSAINTNPKYCAPILTTNSEGCSFMTTSTKLNQLHKSEEPSARVSLKQPSHALHQTAESLLDDLPSMSQVYIRVIRIFSIQCN